MGIVPLSDTMFVGGWGRWIIYLGVSGLVCDSQYVRTYGFGVGIGVGRT